MTKGTKQWATRVTVCPGGVRVEVSRGSDSARYVDVIDGWRSDPDFCSWFNSVLATASFDAFRWETPPVSTSTVTQPFEFVLLDSPGLARGADPAAFEDQFRRNPNGDVLEFSKLGGDAIMVVPRPIGHPSSYGHLADFVRRWTCRPFRFHQSVENRAGIPIRGNGGLDVVSAPAGHECGGYDPPIVARRLDYSVCLLTGLADGQTGFPYLWLGVMLNGKESLCADKPEAGSRASL